MFKHEPKSEHQALRPKRIKVSRTPALAKIRSLEQRAWLLGAVARIIGPADASVEFLTHSAATRETLRSWLWSSLYAWDLAPLARVVRQASAVGLMRPWPEA